MTFYSKLKKPEKLRAIVQKWSSIICSTHLTDRHSNTLRKIGFTPQSNEGDTILPPPIFGIESRKNSEGWEEIHKDQPKEPYSQPIWWSWREWRGRHESQYREEVRYQHKERYPRTFHLPTGIELSIRARNSGERMITAPAITHPTDNLESLKNSINLLIEIFGECTLLESNFEPLIEVPNRRLNWQILPPGQQPWKRLKSSIDQLLESRSINSRKIIEDRLATIHAYKPKFSATGINGFSGYVIFGFPEKRFYILESAFFGNATYVLGENWEQLSQMTKGELISGGLHQKRIIHQKGWEFEINKILA